MGGQVRDGRGEGGSNSRGKISVYVGVTGGEDGGKQLWVHMLAKGDRMRGMGCEAKRKKSEDHGVMGKVSRGGSKERAGGRKKKEA